MISVLTVNYFSSADVVALAESLRAHGDGTPMELIVTNNSPEDRIPPIDDPALPVQVIESSNIGYGRGINLAYQRSRGEILMVSNPDVRVLPGTVAAAWAMLEEHSDVGVVLPLLRYPDGRTQPSVRRYYNWRVALYARSPLRGLLSPPRFWRRYLYADRKWTEPADVDWGLGAAMFLRRADVRPGGVFDERYFMYFEDVDLCFDMWRRRKRVRYCPHIVCEHLHRRHSARPLSKAGWWHLQSLLRFIGKHRGLPARPRIE